MGSAMPDEPRKGVIEIASEPAAGNRPASVSVYIDGDRRFAVRTSDLENIGAQLRGKKQFSVFYSIVLPVMISLVTIIGTTMIAQFFQYISWRNSAALQKATESSRTRRQRVPESIACSQQAILRNLSLPRRRARSCQPQNRREQ